MNRSGSDRPTRRLRVVLVLVVLALFGAACGADGGDETATESTGVDGSESTTSSAAGETTTTTEATSSTASTLPSASDAAFADLVWTVVAVTWDDVLNVRQDPTAASDVVGTLEPWSQAFTGTDQTEAVGGAEWRLVTLDDGTEGWVNSRYIVAQPAELTVAQQATLVEATTNLVYWALQTEAGHDAAPLLADRALWVGGIGVYADLPLWNWIPATEADSIEDWTSVRTFELTGDAADMDCGSFCDQTLIEFTGFDTLGDNWTVVVDDHLTTDQNGFTDGEFFAAPDGFHRTVVDRPASEGTDEDGNPMIELDWQRIHVVHDWSADATGEPRLLMVHTWGWTP